MNLVANDAQFMADTSIPFVNGMIAPFQILIALGLAAIHVGVHALVGVIENVPSY